MNATAITDRAACARALAVRAGTMALAMRQDLGPLEAKDALDFCTEADRAVERLIRDELVASFGDAVIGEEYGGAAADRVWVIDPIDGTVNFVHGSARWCISIAYVADGTPEIGVITVPATGEIFSAVRGRGAECGGTPIRVSGMAHRASPLVEVGWSSRRPFPRYLSLLHALNRDGCEFRRHGSGALGMVDVARGATDAYLELHINAWDVLAGLVLVREAGGWTNDFLAGGGLLEGNPVLACTPELRTRLAPLIAAACRRSEL